MQYPKLNLRQRRVRTFIWRVTEHQTWLWGEQTVIDITWALSTNVCTVDHRDHCCGWFVQTSFLFRASLSIYPTEHLSKREDWWHTCSWSWISHIRGQPFPGSPWDTVVLEGSRRPHSLLKATLSSNCFLLLLLPICLASIRLYNSL